MKKIFLVLLFGFLFSGNTFADEKPIFPFTVDEQIQTFKDGGENIINNKSNELIKDEYWNTPLTKLDYYLLQLKEKAHEVSKEIKLIHSDGSGYLIEYFEKIENLKKYQRLFGKYVDFEVSSDVYYLEDRGKIVIGFEIRDVGKAKKPMKELCKNLLEKDLFRRGMPDPSFSNPIYYRMLLNQLYRGGERKTYENQLKKIANNIVYQVNITSKVSTSLEKSDYNLFSVNCYKLNDKDEIIYRKWSFESKE
jgi:hypothetical protein